MRYPLGLDVTLALDGVKVRPSSLVLLCWRVREVASKVEASTTSLKVKLIVPRWRSMVKCTSAGRVWSAM